MWIDYLEFYTPPAPIVWQIEWILLQDAYPVLSACQINALIKVVLNPILFP